MNSSEIEVYVFIITGIIVLSALVSFIVYFIIAYKGKQKKVLIEKEQMKTNFDKHLLQTQLEIQEQTLKTISQEIHDNVGQVLSLAKLNLGTFEDTESAYNQTKINDTKQLVSKAINDLRDLSRSLHGDKIAELGLQDAIANELKILQNTGQYQTELKITGESYKLEPQKEMVLFRILQEAINNAIKHSKAKKIQVQLAYQRDLFLLSITDDGVGFNLASLQSGQTGIGLKSMQNRAALIGAGISINSIPGDGTVISIELKPNNNLTG